MMHVSYAAKADCWNTWSSYGEICIHCGCCGKDPLERAQSRHRELRDREQYWRDYIANTTEDRHLENAKKALARVLKEEKRYRNLLTKLAAAAEPRCTTCYWYADFEGVCCCPDSVCRAGSPEEYGHDTKAWACDKYKKGTWWDEYSDNQKNEIAG